MTEVHFLVPRGYADPARPSGGNSYDRHLIEGLGRAGWIVRVHEIGLAWPAAGAEVAGAVAAALAALPDGAVVVVDGLLATAAAEPLEGQADRLRLATLVHMPGAPGGPPPSVLRSSRLVIATSAWTAGCLTSSAGLPAADVVVATPGVIGAALATGSPAGTTLLCVAAVTEAKGHDLLFAALARLQSSAWALRCVGDLDREPDFVAAQRDRLVEWGIADRVQLTGALAAADLETAYAGADVLVLPTRSESYGMVVTEALARGLPVIASSVGGVPEALGLAPDGHLPGLLVAPDDAGALGAAIETWLADAGLREGLRKAASSRRTGLSGWDGTVDTVATVLSRLVAG